MDSDSSANDQKLNERLARFDLFCEYFEAALNRMPTESVEEFLWITVIYKLGQSNGYTGDAHVTDMSVYWNEHRHAWTFEKLKAVLSDRIREGWDDKVVVKILLILADDYFTSQNTTSLDMNVMQEWCAARMKFDAFSND